MKNKNLKAAREKFTLYPEEHHNNVNIIYSKIIVKIAAISLEKNANKQNML